MTGLFKRHYCETCRKSFGKVEELMQHQQLAHEDRLYECRKCGSSFEGMEQMREHAKRSHSYNKLKESR